MAKTMHERWYLSGFDASGNINRVLSTAGGGLREVQDLRIGKPPKTPPPSPPLSPNVVTTNSSPRHTKGIGVGSSE